MFPRKQARRVEHAATRRHWETWYAVLDTLQKAQKVAALATQGREIAAHFGRSLAVYCPSTGGSAHMIRHVPKSVTPVQVFWRRS